MGSRKHLLPTRGQKSVIVDDLALVRVSDMCLALGIGGVWKGELV